MSCEHCHGPTNVHGDSIAPAVLAWALETADRWEGRYRLSEKRFNELEEELLQLRQSQAAPGPSPLEADVAELRTTLDAVKKAAAHWRDGSASFERDLEVERAENARLHEQIADLEARLGRAEQERYAAKEELAKRPAPIASASTHEPDPELRTVEDIKAAEWTPDMVVQGVELHFTVCGGPAQLLHEKEGYFLRTTDGRRLTQFQDAAGMADWLRRKKVFTKERAAGVDPASADGAIDFDDPSTLKAARIRAGLTQGHVDAALGLLAGNASSWERGVNPVPQKYRERLQAILSGASGVVRHG